MSYIYRICPKDAGHRIRQDIAFAVANKVNAALWKTNPSASDLNLALKAFSVNGEVFKGAASLASFGAKDFEIIKVPADKRPLYRDFTEVSNKVGLVEQDDGKILVKYTPEQYDFAARAMNILMWDLDWKDYEIDHKEIAYQWIVDKSLIEKFKEDFVYSLSSIRYCDYIAKG